jgi:hypothetical protein
MKAKLLRVLLVFVVGISWFLFAANVKAETKTLTAQWEMTDTTNLKEWKLFWSDVTGGPYEEILVIPYDPNDPGPIYTSPATVTVTGPQGTTVTKYFVMISCGDIPQEGGGTQYLCSGDSNEASADFWIPAGQFSVPLNFQITAVP